MQNRRQGELFLQAFLSARRNVVDAYQSPLTPHRLGLSPVCPTLQQNTWHVLSVFVLELSGRACTQHV